MNRNPHPNPLPSDGRGDQRLATAGFMAAVRVHFGRRDCQGTGSVLFESGADATHSKTFGHPDLFRGREAFWYGASAPLSNAVIGSFIHFTKEVGGRLLPSRSHFGNEAPVGSLALLPASPSGCVSASCR